MGIPTAGGSGRDLVMMRWVLAVGILAATGALALLLGSLDWGGLLIVLGGTQVSWLLPALAANAAILVLWAFQWTRLLPQDHRVSLRRMLKITSVMAFTVNAAPLATGQALGAGLLARWGGVGGGRALSVLAMDQLAEGFAKVTVLLLALTLTPLPPGAREALVVLAVLVGGLGLLLTLGSTRIGGEWLRTRVEAWTGRTRLAGAVTRWNEGLASMRSPKRWIPILGIALAMKGAELAGILLVQTSVGVSPSVSQALVVLSASMLVTILPLTPGNLGTYEAGVVAAYTFLGFPAETALALALLQHLCLMIPMMGTGYLVLLREGGRSLAQARAFGSIAPSEETEKPAAR